MFASSEVRISSERLLQISDAKSTEENQHDKRRSAQKLYSILDVYKVLYILAAIKETITEQWYNNNTKQTYTYHWL